MSPHPHGSISNETMVGVVAVIDVSLELGQARFSGPQIEDIHMKKSKFTEEQITYALRRA